MMEEMKDPAERFVWFGFLLLAGDSPFDGKITLTENIGYSNTQLAELLKCDREVIKKAKRKMIKYGKIEMYPNQIIQICNWHKYQSEYKRQAPYRGRLQNEVTNNSDIEKLQIERDKKEIEKENKKEIRKENKYTQEELDQLFEKWWKRYPIKDDKGKAKSKWLNLVINEGIDPEELEDALTGYINYLHANGTDNLKYVKHAKTFLYNGDKKKKIDPTWKPFVKYADPKYKRRPEL